MFTFLGIGTLHLWEGGHYSVCHVSQHLLKEFGNFPSTIGNVYVFSFWQINLKSEKSGLGMCGGFQNVVCFDVSTADVSPKGHTS